MNVKNKKLWIRAAVCGFALAALAGWFPFAAACAQLPEEVLRLHVVANSDSPEDQAVKLKVRDAVLEEAAKWCAPADSMEQASAALCVHLGSLRKAAAQALRSEGAGEEVTAQMTDMYFTTRQYGDFALPAGKYRTLRITVGEGKGKNWWCVVFPTLCLPAAEPREDVLAGLPDSQRDIVEQPEKYKVKFKAVELWEELKKLLEGK